MWMVKPCHTSAARAAAAVVKRPASVLEHRGELLAMGRRLVAGWVVGQIYLDKRLRAVHGGVVALPYTAWYRPLRELAAEEEVGQPLVDVPINERVVVEARRAKKRRTLRAEHTARQGAQAYTKARARAGPEARLRHRARVSLTVTVRLGARVSHRIRFGAADRRGRAFAAPRRSVDFGAALKCGQCQT